MGTGAKVMLDLSRLDVPAWSVRPDGGGWGREADVASVALPASDMDGSPVTVHIGVDGDVDEVALRAIAAAEGEHRARNVISVALAIAGQSLGPLVEEPAVARFLDRLQSLSAVARVGCEVKGDRCDIMVVADEIATRIDGEGHQRIALHGAPVTLASRWAFMLTVILHELGVNALRHGSLTAAEGSVDVLWEVDRSDAHQPVLTLEWRERGGRPPSPGAPGFGTRIVRDMVNASPRCRADLEMAADGLRYRLGITLTPRDVDPD